MLYLTLPTLSGYCVMSLYSDLVVIVGSVDDVKKRIPLDAI